MTKNNRRAASYWEHSFFLPPGPQPEPFYSCVNLCSLLGMAREPKVPQEGTRVALLVAEL